ncbi:MAG: hypothetical protein WCC48_16765 [Anaeromyxobacteraceae bacterium]
MRGRSILPVLALFSLAACSGGAPAPAAKAVGIGRLIAATAAHAALPSPDGAWVAWLDGCRDARGQFLPYGTANCDLRVAPVAGGAATRVGGAVTTLPHGMGWSPEGATLAALADYDYAAGSGTLRVWRGGAVTEVARDVTFHGFGPHGELGFVSGGKLSVLLPGEAAPRALAGGEDVTSFELSPADPKGCAEGRVDRVRLLARRTRAAGGKLLGAGCALAEAKPIAERAGEYGFAPDGSTFAFTVEGKDGGSLRLAPAGSGSPLTVGRAVQRFDFAPSGRSLAFLGDVSPGKEGNLYLAEPGRAAVQLAKDVGDHQWAARAPRIAWLEAYDPRVRSGVLGVGGPKMERRIYGRNVTDLDLSSDGRFVAFLQHTTRGGYSVDLGLASLDAPAATPPAVIAHGVFGFAFSPDAKWLYYRTRCTRNGEGCELERVPAAGLAKDAKPQLIAQGMKSFEFDPRDPARVLVGWQRTDRQALDIGVWQGERLLRVDENVLPGSARFLGPDSRRLCYAVVDPKRAGIYVAEPGSSSPLPH